MQNDNYKAVVSGKGCIVARVVADSISKDDCRITTLELEYPRFIHSELMTHRVFSRNAASSRAIPASKMIEQVRDNPAMPIHWGANQPGMQADSELADDSLLIAKGIWNNISKDAVAVAGALDAYGAHKQLVNRILEPFQIMKTVVTATELDNFFELRCHKDAQPEIRELAECMRKAMSQSEPDLLADGQWHLPYVPRGEEGYYIYDLDDECIIPLTTEEALKVSASCCAQVSYRLLDHSLEKAIKIYDQLINSKPIHASPFEHQAKPMEYIQEDDENLSNYISPCMDGATHTDRDRYNWSGNFKGWIQYRQLL